MLRPIDVTLTIQHAADAHRASTDGQARPEVASQMFADRLEKQTKMQEQQVMQASQSEKNEVQPDRQGHGGGYQPNRKGQKKPADKAKPQSKPTGESLYDIRI
jgi:hypothetical protein